MVIASGPPGIPCVIGWQILSDPIGSETTMALFKDSTLERQYNDKRASFFSDEWFYSFFDSWNGATSPAATMEYRHLTPYLNIPFGFPKADVEQVMQRMPEASKFDPFCDSTRLGYEGLKLGDDSIGVVAFVFTQGRLYTTLLIWDDEPDSVLDADYKRVRSFLKRIYGKPTVDYSNLEINYRSEITLLDRSNWFCRWRFGDGLFGQWISLDRKPGAVVLTFADAKRMLGLYGKSMPHNGPNPH